ncbi:MAG: GGDEF domain-containing protein [Aliidiomarina sp.]|uniref:GGDEF domain-containing protein n=1 Tax=Aliidiomarina sp. TaxID=1872439 RepID=UPI0025C4D2A1|nr:GGDEF domain-containing protein [Aliidiomarina sp.]MCH8501742.1 GGDEF domain-containing protein [Aliidiomarina sp.]
MPHVAATIQSAIDLFPCGLVVTKRNERTIVAANQHFYDLCPLQPGSSASISAIFTNASRIMLESYVMPLLLSKQQCDEIQLSIEKENGERLPVLVNARITTEFPELIHWVITAAKQRDELYQELVNLRNHLEYKAEVFSNLARTDELTGLLNRRAFIENAEILIGDAQRQQRPYAFFMMDIDNFKAINDRYGHDVGDRVLRDIANIFKPNVRDTDTLARVGGEEFAIVAQVQSAEHAKAYAERLREAVSAESVAGIQVTISIGLATSKQHSLSQLFKHADKLLYAVKNTGKNQVMLTAL